MPDDSTTTRESLDQAVARLGSARRAFGHFGLELWAAGARQVLVNDPVADDVTGHPCWRPLLHFEVHAMSIWRSGEVDSPDPAPVALVLTADGARIWIASGETNPVRQRFDDQRETNGDGRHPDTAPQLGRDACAP